MFADDEKLPLLLESDVGEERVEVVLDDLHRSKCPLGLCLISAAEGFKRSFLMVGDKNWLTVNVLVDLKVVLCPGGWKREVWSWERPLTLTQP